MAFSLLPLFFKSLFVHLFFYRGAASPFCYMKLKVFNKINYDTSAFLLFCFNKNTK